MQSIELTGESKKRFRYFYLVPDSKSLAEERESASYDREAEELLGEATTNLSKVNTTIKTSTAINTVHHLRAYLANICAVIEATNQPHRPLILWVVQMLDQLSILLTHPFRHTKNASLVAQDNINDIATNKFIEAFDLLDNCVSTLCKFKSGTGTIPSCPLLQADKLKQAKSKLDQLKRAAPVDNHRGQPSSNTKKARPSVITPTADNLRRYLYLQREARRDDAIG